MCGSASWTIARRVSASDRLAAVPALAQRGSRGLGLGPRAQLAEREAEQLLDVQQVLEARLVVGVVEPVPAARAPALGQEPELLVVAHGARGRARAAGELADAELLSA